VVLVPEEDVETPPGFLVRVHVPADGKPPAMTLPVETLQSGWVIVPITGGEGVSGCGVITTFADGVEVHPDALVTVNV